MVKISVIIPVYNVKRYLKTCLDSVVNQSFQDFEVICVNDGSTDGSLEILKQYADNHDNIKIITKNNGGLGSARNAGLDACLGDYIFFLDSDDYIDVNALEKLYENAISNGSDLVFNKIARFNDQNNIDYKRPGYDFYKTFKDDDFSNLTFDYKDIKKHVLNSSFSAWSKLYNKSFLDKFDDFTFPQGIAYEDVLFHVKAVTRANRMSYVNEFLYFYRNNPNSIVNNNNGFDIFTVVDSVEDYLKANNLTDEFEEEFKKFKIAQITNYVLISQSDDYFQFAKKEIEDINLDDKSVLYRNRRKLYELFLECENLYEYYTKYYNSEIDDLKQKNRKLKKEIKHLKKDNDSLKDEMAKKNKSKFKKIFPFQ